MRPLEQAIPVAVLQPITINMATAAKLSGIKRTSLYELINSGQLKTTKVGRTRLVYYDGLVRLLKGEPAEAA